VREINSDRETQMNDIIRMNEYNLQDPIVASRYSPAQCDAIQTNHSADLQLPQRRHVTNVSVNDEVSISHMTRFDFELTAVHMNGISGSQAIATEALI
jgi:hypothetical protein